MFINNVIFPNIYIGYMWKITIKRVPKMSISLDNAKRILGQIEGLEAAKQAKTQLDKAFNSTDKIAGLGGSTIRNIIILLTPFIAYYKVNQVLNLLKEVQSEISRDESSSGFKKYI